MEKNTELEICRREVESVKLDFKLAIILSLGWVVISFMINCIIGLCHGDLFDMFDGGSYWFGFGNMILGLVLAIIFIILHFLPSRKLNIVLTNKRIYVSILRKSFFRRKLEVIESYNLSKIVNYCFTKVSNTKRSFSQLLLKTPSSQINLIIDVDFYNQFVDAVNNAC